MATMDTSGFSQVGRYGTISLMKRHEPNTVVTAFGVDSEELTFGRDPGCSVRLYYPDVSLVHCKIVFEDRKAFLVVLGEAGLFIDGCKVYPNNPAAGSLMTIPLTNNSELEIHYKRFRFSYPPKDLRATLMASPAPPRNRALRLSMIQSAQVFTPRPSKDPRENLRVLQSPLKNTFKSPSKPSSLSRPPLNAPEEEEEIVLVDGNHPLVVEEERDLVILEDVEVQPSAPPVPPQYQAPPQTPQRKRSLSRNTLHRAVLIRSAQRAVLRAEKEREEEEEEMEVLGAVAANVEESDEEANQGSEEEYTDEDEDGEQESEQQTTEQKSLWRKSLERIWPFGSSSGAEEELDDDGAESNSESETDHTPTSEIPQDDEQDDAEMEEEENLAPLPTVPIQTPARRVLGSFMTPQARGSIRTTLFPHLADIGQAPPPQLAPGGSVGRHSLGGIEAKRVPLPQTWRVKDIVVPINPAPPITPQGVRRGTGFSLQQTTPRAAGFSGRQTLTEEERKAIQERRRSALRQADTFFVGGVPGMSPSKPTPASSSSSGFAASNSASPVKLASSLFAVRSPVKPGQAADRRESTGDDEEELDTRSLLERMKETVEGMKRRRSMAPGVSLDSTPRPGREFSTPREIPSTPLPALFAAAVGPVRSELEDIEKELVQDKELDSVEDVPFSLLAPGAREELLTRRQSVVVLDQASTVPVVIHAASDDEINVDEPSTEKTTATKERPKARLLRSKKSPEEAEVPIEEQESAKLNVEPKTKARTGARRGATPRIPTPQPEPEVDVGEPDVPEPKSKVPTSRRTRTRTADPQETPAPPMVAKRGSARKATVETEEVPAAPARRGRKAIVEPEPEEVPEAKAVVRRGRKPAAAVVKEDENEDAVVPAPTTVKRGIRKGAATPTPTELTEGQPTSSKPAAAKKRGNKVSVDDEADPLAIEVHEEDETSAPKTKGKKKVVAVKQEDELEDHADLPPPSKKPVRKPTAVKTPAAKPRAGRKTPASAPATVEGEVDKENTPRSMSPATPEVAEEGAVKVRVPRTRGTKAAGAATSKTKVKVEDNQEVDDPARGRSMRSRTRTKTG